MLKLETIATIGRDAVMKDVGEKKVINFSAAHTEKFKDKEKTVWIECALWSGSEKLLNLLKKGVQLYIEGSPEVRMFQKNDGSPGASLSVRILNFKITKYADDPQKIDNSPPSEYEPF